MLDLLSKASRHEDSHKVFEVWADVFEIDENDQNKINLEISRCLNLMQDEIDSIQKDMGLPALDEFHCASILKSVNQLFAVHMLMSGWQGQRDKLTREVFLCLGYCREVLPDEESLISKNDFDEIHQLLNTLGSQLENSSLPSHTNNIIKNHIDGILKALHSYKIVGAESLQQAMKTIVGDVIVNEEIFSEAKGSKEIGTLKKLFRKVQTVSDKVVKTEKLLTSGAEIAQHGSKALEVFQSLT